MNEPAILEITLGRQALRIYDLRGHRVLLDSDLASLYGVSTYRFNEQVKRNLARFPAEFMFQLIEEEFSHLRSQNAISSVKHGGRRHLPFVFTEHGAIMAATILNSQQAVEMSVYVVKAFVEFRTLLSTHKELAKKLLLLEKKVVGHDKSIAVLIDAIRQLMPVVSRKSRSIGFTADIS